MISVYALSTYQFEVDKGIGIVGSGQFWKPLKSLAVKVK